MRIGKIRLHTLPDRSETAWRNSSPSREESRLTRCSSRRTLRSSARVLLRKIRIQLIPRDQAYRGLAFLPRINRSARRNSLENRRMPLERASSAARSGCSEPFRRRIGRSRNPDPGLIPILHTVSEGVFSEEDIQDVAYPRPLRGHNRF
jgi:hypothetical protein